MSIQKLKIVSNGPRVTMEERLEIQELRMSLKHGNSFQPTIVKTQTTMSTIWILNLTQMSKLLLKVQGMAKIGTVITIQIDSQANSTLKENSPVKETAVMVAMVAMEAMEVMAAKAAMAAMAAMADMEDMAAMVTIPMADNKILTTKNLISLAEATLATILILMEVVATTHTHLVVISHMVATVVMVVMVAIKEEIQDITMVTNTLKK